jgi:hypothetical protein
MRRLLQVREDFKTSVPGVLMDSKSLFYFLSDEQALKAPLLNACELEGLEEFGYRVDGGWAIPKIDIGFQSIHVQNFFGYGEHEDE